MKLLLAMMMLFGMKANAQSYPEHSLTFNVDFKDPDALAAAALRLLHNGMWFGGARYDPMSLYRVDDAKGDYTRWARLGLVAAANTEKNSVLVGPHLGLEVAQWNSKAQVAGVISSAAKLWKPLGFASVTATVDLFAAPFLYHTPDIKGWGEYGYGFSVQGKFGGAGGAGGTSPSGGGGGAGARGIGDNLNGLAGGAGAFPGGGGGGGGGGSETNSHSGGSGGAGAAGEVLVWEYY